MNDEAFNLSIRRFLKMVGVNSQRQIEQAVAAAIANGSITGRETFPAKVSLRDSRTEVARFLRRRNSARMNRRPRRRATVIPQPQQQP